ncbi:hypothetical protein [Mucilaginibacter antarcticus]|uniref:hypothetical protein n=1 Tax=Mucilaginibacter antarcticus TaxID=1855725 RepID=UPI00363A903C
MKRFLLLCPLLFLALLACAQKPLTNSRISSYYTYTYKLNDVNTQLFISGRQAQIKEESLTEEVAKYPTDHPESPILPRVIMLKY